LNEANKLITQTAEDTVNIKYAESQRAKIPEIPQNWAADERNAKESAVTINFLSS